MNSMISLACLIVFFCCTALAGPIFPYAPAAYAPAYGKGYYTPLLPGPAPLAAVPAAPAVPALPAPFAAPAPVAAPVAPAAVVPEFYPATAALNYLGYPYGYPYYSYPYGAYVAPYKK
ncbi:hypothetical protein AVEN_14045-1 [Araneus ventricosus]|uniref:Uncharacterized protein n=1 Tax=Araneus ventricosus TaxID=182803 RepID=A0A4Y2UUE6_ARAVE|nr:hypothetical protein AVEN_267088-1 [Araneus ventricosus]GBO15823.1 hypothetical protein AVEN_14045-1 [Araneus ventricosus]